MMHERGMTLLEIMVVVVIISMIGTVVAVNVNEARRRAMVRTAAIQVTAVSDAAERFWLDERRIPTRLDELVPRYLKTSDQLLDPWGTRLVLQRPGPEGFAFIIGSYGEDCQPGGIEFAEDIWSHQPRRE